MPDQPMIAAVLFDMDGVLIDTEPLYMKAMQAAARELGYHMTDAQFTVQIGAPADEGDRLMRGFFGDDFPVARYNEMARGTVRAWLEDDVPLKPGVMALLERLKALGLPVAVATSTSSPTAETHLERAGLMPFFKSVVTRNQVSRGKPFPDPYLLAAERVATDPAACLVIEDSHNGVRSAHAAGAITVMVPDLLPPTAEIEALCHAVLDDLDAVAARFFPD